jgi:hypothetical protein
VIFEATCKSHALYDTFGDAAEFEPKLARGLTRIVTERFAARSEAASHLPVGRRLTMPPERKPEARLGAHLESHGRSSYRLVLANVGTVDVNDVNVEVPPEPGLWRGLHVRDSVGATVSRTSRSICPPSPSPIAGYETPGLACARSRRRLAVRRPNRVSRLSFNARRYSVPDVS